MYDWLHKALSSNYDQFGINLIVVCDWLHTTRVMTGYINSYFKLRPVWNNCNCCCDWLVKPLLKINTECVENLTNDFIADCIVIPEHTKLNKYNIQSIKSKYEYTSNTAL